MEDLIFVLPTFIIFFVILFRILSLFKRGFDFVRKNFNLTIDQADKEMTEENSALNSNSQYNKKEVKKRIAEAEQESLVQSKKRILKEKSDSKNREKNNKDLNNKQLNKKKEKNKNNSLGKIFSQYDEVQKAVIYNEILSKPKALKND